MGEGRSDGGRSVRIYFNPLASLIWIGALIMFIGGAVSLTDRRYRIGVPSDRGSPPSRPSRRAALLHHHRDPAAVNDRRGGRARRGAAIDPAGSGARALSSELRCLVCQNQSIDESDAPLAKDLRMLIRERLKAGASDAQARDFMVERYGDFVLLRPRFAPETLLLWVAPSRSCSSASFSPSERAGGGRPPATPRRR